MCKTQFILLVLSSALGGIRALLKKSESEKERERKHGVAFVENLTHAQIASKMLAQVSTARNCSRSCARTDRNEKIMRRVDELYKLNILRDTRTTRLCIFKGSSHRTGTRFD
ncbi:hypothetical protein TNCV_4504151 [Trichonephila clavipes]|nr:hypothetical protein TNCV_4504151 [Trichonephila clavipes]